MLLKLAKSSELGLKLYSVLYHILPSTLVTHFLFQQTISLCNALLIYKLGKAVLRSESKALVACYLYILSHSAVY